MYRANLTPLTDCAVHGAGSGAELFLVEGESAAKAVVRARNPNVQAVLAMQGKPLNAWKASAAAVSSHAIYRELIAVLDAGWQDSLQPQRGTIRANHPAVRSRCRRHPLQYPAAAVLLPLDAATAGRRLRGAIRPPLYRIAISRPRQIAYAFTTDHLRRLREALIQQGVRDYRVQHYRGLASMTGHTLATTCLDPATRNHRPLGPDDAQTALAQLGAISVESHADGQSDSSESGVGGRR